MVSYSLLNSRQSSKIRNILEDIPGVKIVSMRESASEGYYVTTVDIKGKGSMTFLGWSIHPDQLLPTNTRSIGVSQIGNCQITVITPQQENAGKSIREWTTLNTEVNRNLTTIQKAIEHYDVIYETVKSWPPYEGQQEAGTYSKC